LVVSVKELLKVRGRLANMRWRGIIRECAIITNAPEKMPPTPMPAIALPTIKAVLEGATPHINDPNSKMKIAIKKTALVCHLSVS